MISQRAVDLIVSCEVSSRAYYEKYYRHPEWPGGASGVTIAIGYDLGYTDLAKCHADWQLNSESAELRVIDRCLGVHGEPARALLGSVRADIDIPWDDAMVVFIERDVPQWTAAVLAAIPGANKLSADCLGALVSLAYNRGASFSAPGDRYREMRNIKAHIGSGNLAAVAGDIRAMKRLWPGVHGLQARRDAEAQLWVIGLATLVPPPAKHVANEAPSPALAPHPAGAAEHTSSGGAGAAAAKAAHDSMPPEHVWSAIEIALAVGGVIAVMIVVWLVIRQYRKSQPVLARAKDTPDVIAAVLPAA